MTKKKTSTLFIRTLDSKIKNKFKAWCADQNKSMREVIEILMDIAPKWSDIAEEIHSGDLNENNEAD